MSPEGGLSLVDQERAAMVSTRRLNQVLPDARVRSGPSPDDAATWLYELRPAHDPPVVDFSVSMRSRFLNKRWLARTTSLIRHGRLFLSSFVLGMGILSAMFVTQEAGMAQALAVVSALLQLPSYLVGISVLRFEMVRLLVKTYDFWFFFVCNLALVIVLSVQFGDARVIAAIAFCAGVTNNILIDGNLRGARRMVFINVGAVATMVFFVVGVKIELIVSLRSFTLLRYGAHELPAQGFTISCVITLVAMISRNIVRSRQALPKGKMPQIQCVSYRCLLRLVRCHSPPPTTSHTHRVIDGDSAVGSEVVSPIQQIQCVLPIGLIDARKTIVPWAMNLIAKSRFAQLLVRTTGISAFIVSCVNAMLVDYRLSANPSPISTLQLTAIALTAAFMAASGTCFLRQVHHVLILSFDFLYVSLLITTLHLTACDFFRWRSCPCLVVLVSWLWIHWAMCVDELSPLVKETLRIHVRFPAVVISVGIVACCTLVYAMIVLDTSDQPYDRVLWSGTVLRKQVVIRVIPFFFDSVASVLAWSTRLLYRAWCFDSDMMIVLDGVAAYTNYMNRLPRETGGQQQPLQRIVSRPRMQSGMARTLSVLLRKEASSQQAT